MSKTTNKFREQYARCRAQSGLTYRALAKITSIKHSALVSMQTGTRPCGEHSARCLAKAFGLSGETFEAFVLTALSTSKERVLQAVSGYPAEVLNALGLLLLAHGIPPQQVSSSEFDALSFQKPCRLRLSLADGRQLLLETRLTFPS